MSKSKLKNAPLKEVIFELFWEGKLDYNGVTSDEGFELGQGKFASLIKDKFPVHKKTIPDGLPVKFYRKPIHQYWSGEFKWPVIQHGEGILAVNETEIGYVWEANFKEVIVFAIRNIFLAYDHHLKLVKAKLQYIDAWDVDHQDSLRFVEQNLQTQIRANYTSPGKFKNFNIFQSFELDEGSEMQINISNGVNNQNQKSSIFWTTTFEKEYKFTEENLLSWLDFAHDHTSNMFVSMLNPEFYDSLDQ